ncbi:hypothetical protein Clacol_008618 [Clathrus columnatus]|uniref:Uncharacterized protein n=1 Tax=Clathrus columnatus TaxID=1419009 RepID=A0AAV5AIB8_9AGAM|nr:hypothetical protein Clacol_008618 [Clathrus columnatus]
MNELSHPNYANFKTKTETGMTRILDLNKEMPGPPSAIFPCGNTGINARITSIPGTVIILDFVRSNEESRMFTTFEVLYLARNGKDGSDKGFGW